MQNPNPRIRHPGALSQKVLKHRRFGANQKKNGGYDGYDVKAKVTLFAKP
jgi:hypothetical protein